MNKNQTLGPTTFPKRHLFIDTDPLVQWDDSLEQRFYQAERVPITGLGIGLPGSWDARLTSAYGSTLVEDGLFRKWYGVMPDANHGDGDPDHWLTCYAESEDGINWRKPDLKITGQNRWPGNNLVGLPGCVMSVVRALPGAGYKYLALTLHKWPEPEPDVCEWAKLNTPGMYLFGSDDGLNWKQMTPNAAVQHGDWAVLHADRMRNRYLMVFKVGAVHRLIPRRSAVVIESEDGIHWKGYEGTRQWDETCVPDDYDDLVAAQKGHLIAELYGYTLHQVENLYLAVQNIMMVGLPLQTSLRQNPNGISYLRMAFSHNGKIWRFPPGRPALFEVRPPGEFDAGFVLGESNIVEHGDEQYFYYCGCSYRHGWCITADFAMRQDIPTEKQRGLATRGLAKIKRDRFASLAGSWETCFDVEVGPRQGDELTVNVHCHKGTIRIAIAEQSMPLHGEPRKNASLPGFSFDDCVPLTTDDVRAAVRFKKARISDIPKDMFLIVRFELKTGELFGYEWK